MGEGSEALKKKNDVCRERNRRESLGKMENNLSILERKKKKERRKEKKKEKKKERKKERKEGRKKERKK